MLEAQPHRLEVPELPTTKLNNARVFEFVESIFALNGIEPVAPDFFSYQARAEWGQKKFQTTRFLSADKDKPPLIFEASAYRISNRDFEASQARAERYSEGRSTLAEYGYETYAISSPESGPGLQAVRLLLSVRESHKSGFSNMNEQDSTKLGGNILDEANKQFDSAEYLNDDAKNQRNRIIIATLLDLV